MCSGYRMASYEIPGLLYGIICLILFIICSFAQTILVLLTEKDKEDKK